MADEPTDVKDIEDKSTEDEKGKEEKLKPKSVLSTLSTSVFLPLIPWGISVFIKIIYFGKVTTSMFQPTDIAFSVAMYFMMCMVGTKRLSDKELSNSLFMPYLAFSSILMSLFAVSVFINTYIENELIETFNYMISSKDMNITIENTMESILNRIRMITIILSILGIVISEIARNKYKIEV